MLKRLKMKNKRYISYDEYCTLVSSVCRDIALSQWVPDYVVGITRGGLLPATMISHYFNIPCRTLEVSLSNPNSLESNLWMAEEAFGYVDKEDRGEIVGWSDIEKRKKILIVDDINDTGATIDWILSDWPAGCLPDAKEWGTIWNNNVRFAVLFDNLRSKGSLQMDYVGEEIDKLDSWIVFPYEEWWK